MSGPGASRSVRSPDSRLTSPRLRPTASEVRYSAISSGEAIRANSNLSFPMLVSSGLLVVVFIIVVGALPRDGNLDLCLPLFLARLDFHGQVAVGEDLDALFAERQRQRPRPDAVRDPIQRLRRFCRRCDALVLEFLTPHPCPPLQRSGSAVAWASAASPRRDSPSSSA